MSGNAEFTHSNVAIVSMATEEAPILVPSSQFDERLAESQERLGLRPGLLEEVAGIESRRWWPEGFGYTDAAARAGEKALVAAGIDRSEVGMLIDTSVCRDRIEPSSAVSVHHELGLSGACVNFDLSNACLGFVNAIHLAGTMIDAGTINYALIVDGEGSREVQEATLERLSKPEATLDDYFAEFATLTLGSGAVGMVVGRKSEHPEGHQIHRGIARAATQHHELCVGTLSQMRTQTQAMLEAGLELAEGVWKEVDSQWSSMDRYFIHQVSARHTSELCLRLGLDQSRAPLTFPTTGNIGPASVPYTMANNSDDLRKGDRVLLLGIGSGINTAATEIEW